MTSFVSHGPDRRDGRVYDLSDDLQLAIEVALAADRPLLLSGDPGSGKSSLAPYYARQNGLRYYEHVVTSRTQATDLLWTFDSVRRLADAQAHHGQLHDGVYVNPGALWWAFAPESAHTRGGLRKALPYSDPHERFHEEYRMRSAVVLIDEIDKADPDVPNGLLVPLGSQEFTVADTGTRICRETAAGSPLVVITTNGERQLPDAFLRRCVTYTLPGPTRESLMRIAELHLRDEGMPPDGETLALMGMLADELMQAREGNGGMLGREGLPSTAEYLDALWACRALGMGPRHPRWPLLRNLTLAKSSQRDG
ncbi:AAA family ATPase [Streptomyces sp. NBC_00343]|uniref:AAA family ATPase n=1 Tax=Streptomyces sp. NBC_00343 TaxID=2975719 RepID=UPI002E2BF857|nr:MoxR family ATPase [Streptomyces sp. NBC_00343]